MSRALTELYPVGPQTRLDPVFLNGLIREIEGRIAALDTLKEGLSVAIASAENIALDRVNETVTPALEELAVRLEEAQTLFNEAAALREALEDQKFEIGQINGLGTALKLSAAATVVNSNYFARPGETIAADVSAGSFNITLPEQPVAGAVVNVQITKGDPAEHSLFILGNGQTIGGDTELEIDISLFQIALIYDGSDWRFSFADIIGAAPPPDVQIIDADYTAAAGEKIAADVSTGAWTLSLPAAPIFEDVVAVSIIAGVVADSPLTIDGNGNTINGDATVNFDIQTAAVRFVFNGQEWRLING